jgi:small subunit ribosomal protein S2
MADACIEGQERYAERQQAEADKEIEEESEVTTFSAELKPGERKIISDGTEGPVVEIIKRSGVEASELIDLPEAAVESQSSESEENSEAEKTGEHHDNS